jgi:hypothetical protein
MTLADCLNLPVGSDERLRALEAWRREEDARLAQNLPAVKVPSGNRLVGRPPSVPAVAEMLPVPIDPAQTRREWERRKEASDAQREADQAVAIRARLKKAAALTAHRLNALSDIATKKEKLRRLAELEASLSAHKDPKTLIAISNGFVEIEQRLLRLTAE